MMLLFVQKNIIIVKFLKKQYMKVIFEYKKTDEGHSLHMQCLDNPKPVDVQEYANCFKTIQKYIKDNHLTDVE